MNTDIIKKIGIKKIVIGIIVIVAVIMELSESLGNFSGFSYIKSLFGGQELTIENTENVVESVRKIAELTTANYYEELVMTESHKSGIAKNKVVNAVSTFLNIDKALQNELCIIASGNVRAGYDLKNVGKDRLSINGDTLFVKLPEPEILDVIVNPSNFEIVAEDGKWSHEEVVTLETKAKKQIEADAIAAGVLDKAASSGQTKMAEMFKAFGFKHVVME